MKKSLIITSLIGIALQTQAFYEPVTPKKKATAHKVAGTTQKASRVVIASARPAMKKNSMAGSIKSAAQAGIATATSKAAYVKKPATAESKVSVASSSSNNAMVNSFKAQPVKKEQLSPAASDANSLSMMPAATTPASSSSSSTVAPQTQTQAMKLPASPAVKAAATGWKFAGSFALTREAQIKNQESEGKVTRAENLTFDLLPRISYDKVTLTTWLQYNQDLKDSSASDWSDPILILSRSPWELGKYIKYGLSGIGSIPVSKTSRQVNEFKGSLGVANKFSLNSAAVGAPGFAVSLTLGGATNFNDATTSTKGEPLNQYSLNQKFDIGYTIGSFTVSALFYHYSRFSYENVVRESYWSGAELGWEFNPTFNVALGLYNGNLPVYKAPTYEYNVKFIDDENTMIYGKVGANW